MSNDPAAANGFAFHNAENREGFSGIKGSALDIDGQMNSLIGNAVEDSGFKCPVYKCTKRLENDIQLD